MVTVAAEVKVEKFKSRRESYDYSSDVVESSSTFEAIVFEKLYKNVSFN